MTELTRHPERPLANRVPRRAAACLSALLALGVGTTSAAAQYRFDHWTTDNGLPQNSVRDVVQTRDGYVWLTTFDGLVRFDGVRFTVFNKSNTAGLPGNRFTSLLEDRSGDLWATMETGEIVRQHQRRFTTYTQAHGLPGDPVPWLTEDAQGNVLVFYVRWGLRMALPSVNAVYRWSAGRFEPAADLRYDFSALRLPVEEIQTMQWGRIIEGDYWIVTARRIIRYRKRGGVQVYDDGNGLPGKPMTLLLGARLPVHAVSRDAAGRVWLTELKSMRSHMISTQAPGVFVAGAADNEGNYWFGTADNGFFLARRQAVVPQGQSLGLDVREVYPLLERRDGSLWIGSMGQGVFKLEAGVLTQYGASTIRDLHSFNGVVSSLYEDRAGRLWVNGFWRLENGRFIPPPWADAVFSQNQRYAWTMAEDHAGAYWIGMTDGVVRYQNGTVTHFTTTDGLAGNDTKVIIEDGQGGLWLGSYGGLTHYTNGRFTAWKERDGLPGATVRALKLDADGTLWIGTYDSGLGRFKDGHFTRYTTKNGLFDDGVFQMLDDDAGRFWMSSNRGISHVTKRELVDFAEGRRRTVSALAYNKSDGMPSAECNGGRWPAGVRTRDGRLWFPTMAGVAMIDPAGVRTNSQPPPVVIEAMRINNQPAPPDDWDAALENPEHAVHVVPGQDNFEIAYTALSYINPENMRFRYRLEGADADWVDAGARRTAYFSHLSPGDYVFRVIAANADGVWNEGGARVRISVAPPWWRTRWFDTLTVLSAVGLIAAAWQYRVAKLRRVQQAQQAFARQLIESQERERKRIAAELHDSLGQHLLIVRNRAQLGQLAARDAPEFLEQFEWILSSATQSIEEVREIAQNLRPYHLDRLGLTKALEIMLERVAATTRMRFVSQLAPLDDLISKDEAITLYRVVQESLNNVVKHAQATEVRVGVERLTDAVTLTIHDNGRGFSPAAATASASGFGMAGMAERVRMLGGDWRIDSREGHGTLVTIHLPLPATRRA